MNSDNILAILLHNNTKTINKFIFIIKPMKIMSEYYCRLFCKKCQPFFRQIYTDHSIRINFTKQYSINQCFIMAKTIMIDEAFYPNKYTFFFK